MLSIAATGTTGATIIGRGTTITVATTGRGTSIGRIIITGRGVTAGITGKNFEIDGGGGRQAAAFFTGTQAPPRPF